MTKLCPRGKAAAKRKFKVYPSAYANAYASRICAGKIKDPSGVKRKDLFNPIINIKIGIKFLDQLIKKYKGNIGVALSHYNGGSAVGIWPDVKIIPATYPYVVKVLKKSNELAKKAPSIRKQNDLIQAKFNLIQAKEKSEIDLLVAKIDDWLEIYNNYKKNNIN